MQTRIRSVQLLRALAVTLVMFYHFEVPGFDWGFLGVDVFFVISGFVIWLSIAGEVNRSGHFHLARFLRRRFYRLFPALAAMVVLTLVIFAFVINPLGASGKLAFESAFYSLLGASNIVLAAHQGNYFAPELSSNPWLHTWSLGVEAQFYLFLGVSVALLIKLSSLRSVAKPLAKLGFSILLLLSLAGYATSAYFHTTPLIGGTVGFFSPVTRIWEFSLGIAAAAVVLRYGLSTHLLRLTWAPRVATTGVLTLALSLLALAGTSQIPSENFIPLFAGLTLVSVTLVLLTLMENTDNSEVSVGTFRRYGNAAFEALGAIGNASYSIYLWHWPLYVLASSIWSETLPFLQLPLLLGSLSLGLISYAQIEKRFMATQGTPAPRSRFQGLRPVLAFAIIATALWTNAFIQSSFAEELRSSYILDYQPFLDPLCSAEIECRNVFLVGDSNAGQFEPSLVTIFGDRLVDLHQSSCPMLPGTTLQSRRDLNWSDRCNDEVMRVREAMQLSPPSVIFLAISSNYFADSSYRWSIDSRVARQREVTSGLLDWNSWAEVYGHTLVVFEGLPLMKSEHPDRVSKERVWNFDSCTIMDLFRGCSIDTTDWSSEESLVLFRQALFEAHDAAGGRDTFHTFNLDSEICPDRECQSVWLTAHPHLVIYTDQNHLSRAGLQLVEGRLREEIGRFALVED